MIIIQELKHNRFQQVDIPAAKDLFFRVGQRVAPDSQYSGDVVVPTALNKVEAAQMAVAANVEDIPVE